MEKIETIEKAISKLIEKEIEATREKSPKIHPIPEK